MPISDSLDRRRLSSSRNHSSAMLLGSHLGGTITPLSHTPEQSVDIHSQLGPILIGPMHT